MSSLRICLFGAPRLEQEGESVLIHRRKAVALLAYLAVTGQPHSRDALATLLWPEYDQSGARANLRRNLSRLKRALGDQALLVEQAHVGLAPQLELYLDVTEFQQRLAKVPQHSHLPEQLCADCLTALEEATALYTNDFMAGFTLPDSPAFDEWQFFQREGLRQALVGALQQLVGWHAGRHAYEPAIEYGRRWLALDPLHEPAQRQLMRLYAWSGQQAAALRQYQECVRLLEEELGVEPAAETVALYEAIRTRQLEMRVDESASGRVGELLAAKVSLMPERRYVVEELLATGGHGEVYRGRDRVTGQTVVIKRLRPELVRQEPEFVARFIREGETLRRLNHPNIVCALATFEQEGQHHIVMEYVPGGSLRQLLDEQPRLPLTRVLDIALELADALSRAHHLHVIHRDIKPENVLLAADGAPRLTDFGVARLGGDDARMTQTGNFIGSPAYMSPEALRGEELDARSDVWSFGILLYEMLAGRRPFAGTHITSVLVSILNDPVPELQQFRPDVPPPLVNLLQRMLVKERQERIASMRQVAAELEAIRVMDLNKGTRRQGNRVTDADTSIIRSPAHNLPPQLTPFIGREQELADITDMLVNADTRLLTIVGPGGIGKTRLSIQAAATLAARHSQHFTDGVYFVPLAPLTEPEAIVSALAKALDISLYAEQAEPRQQILDYLRPQKMLLLLDNFEHLLKPASLALIDDILTMASGVRLLATSRERLNLQGEQVLLLAGLDTPEAEEATWSRYSALHLFRESARRVRPDFELGSENLTAVIRICQLVQGMPLGILLAAAWLELLEPDEIVAEIEQSFDFLEGEWHDLPARQRSLRAVFNTSWKLLDEVEQMVLSALTVFQGGFTREAAQSVVAASSKTLLRLVHKSWLQREADGRFQIHELLRQYAAEKLTADESHEGQVRDQHAAYFAGQLEKWYGKMRGPDSAEAFAAVAADIANVQAAWRWLVAQQHFDIIVQQMLPGFFRYCEIRFRAPLLLPLVEMTCDALAENESEHQKFLAILLTVQAAFNLGGVSIRFEVFEIILPMYKEALAQAWTIANEQGPLPGMGVWGVVLAWVYGWIRNLEDGLTALTALLPHVRQHGDRWELAFALQSLGHLQYKVLGWENAGQNLLEALHLFQETGDEHEIGFTQRLLGVLGLMQQRFAEAKLHLQAAQSRLEKVGDLEVAAEVNWHLADVHFRLGELDEAFRYLRALRQAHLNLGRTEAANRTLSRESYEALRYSTIDRARETRQQTLTLVQEIDDPLGEAWYTWEMGEIHRVAGEGEAARHWYDKAKGLFERIPDANGAAFYHRGLGDLAHARGDYQEAERHFRLSLELAQQTKHNWAESYAAAGLGRALLASGQPDAAREPLLMALKVAKHTADPGIILLTLARITEWCVATGKYERAVALAALVMNHYASWRETKAQAEAVLTAATAHLPGEQVAAAWKRGGELDLETAVTDLL